MVGDPRESRAALRKTPAPYDGFTGGVNPTPFPPSVLPNLRQSPRLDPDVTIAGQRYQQVDNGRANVLVPVSRYSPAGLADQRATIERSLFMANLPLAGTAYGIAALAGASPQVRDNAMVTAGAVNAMMLGAGPLGTRARSPLPAPPRRLSAPAEPRDSIRYGQANTASQASGANATVTKPMIGTGSRANRRVVLPGYLGSAEHDLSHLMAKGVGGRANTPEETMALTQWANRGAMGTFEKAVIGRARRGEVVEYFVKPLYDAPASAPSSVVLSAQGSRGDFTPRIIPNVAGRRKK